MSAWTGIFDCARCKISVVSWSVFCVQVFIVVLWSSLLCSGVYFVTKCSLLCPSVQYCDVDLIVVYCAWIQSLGDDQQGQIFLAQVEYEKVTQNPVL